ncbi:hypothetical protein HK405_010163, partial [Cladochytrium tenue]
MPARATRPPSAAASAASRATAPDAAVGGSSGGLAVALVLFRNDLRLTPRWLPRWRSLTGVGAAAPCCP